MVIIKITRDGEDKQFGSRPQTTGMKKAFFRYGIEATRIGMRQKEINAEVLNADSADSLQKYNELLQEVDKLYDTKIELIYQAFGGQITVDEILNMPDDENNRLIAQLQMEARGIRKNAPPGAVGT